MMPHLHRTHEELCDYHIDVIAYYERPWFKQARNFVSGQGIDWSNITVQQVLRNQLGNWLQHPPKKIQTYNHHLCHAAAGFQTSPYDRATCVVIDAIGEFDTVSIWGAEYDTKNQARYKRLWSQTYPSSIGLFYSAITQRIGLHPLDEEYITMGMAAWGKPRYVEECRALLEDNLHIGIDPNWLLAASNEDIAASAQVLTEELIYTIMRRAQEFGWSTNLVYMGGVALNCLANRNLGDYFENIWIMPCPGDAGSSLGSAALAHGGRLHWTRCVPWPCNPRNVSCQMPSLIIYSHIRIAGVASGRAEFGPRALGNRSLLADPRGMDIKDRVNEIKRSQKFRPFAPVILAEHVDEFFDMPRGWIQSLYAVNRNVAAVLTYFLLSVTWTVLAEYRLLPADGSGIRALLEAWYASGQDVPCC
jgi:carbamoyltransferase